jgi:hypothetical protein
MLLSGFFVQSYLFRFNITPVNRNLLNHNSIVMCGTILTVSLKNIKCD